MLNGYHDNPKGGYARQHSQTKARAVEASVFEPLLIAVGALSLFAALLLSAQPF